MTIASSRSISRISTMTRPPSSSALNRTRPRSISTIHSNFLQARFGSAAEIKTYDGLDTALADLGAARLDYVQEGRSTMAPFLASEAGKDYEEKAVVPADPIMGEGVGAAVRKDD